MEATFWQRLVRGVRSVPPSRELEQSIGPDWADRIMAMPVTDRLHVKQGRSIGRLVLESGRPSLVVYLKRHYRLPWRHGLLALLRPGTGWSPAFQEWDHLRWAQSQGLPVPDVVGGGEFIGPWGRLQSFLAIKELTSMLPLHQAIPAAATQLAPADFDRWKRGLAIEMARLAAELHRRHRFHKDFYLCHFYVAAEDTVRPVTWSGRVWLIDLHRLGHHPWIWPWCLAKDLGQLWYSSEIHGVNGRDRAFFWHAYRKANPQACTLSWLRPLIRLKAWTYRRHSRRGGRRSIPQPVATHTEPAAIAGAESVR
ncbi:MAG TPA: lipopolysaccharide kinase InaA family protein [Gemmataceae bacterium]|nr:lipopolysaccharide kinase InaA family protein [Gemmataceae bacterium]